MKYSREVLRQILDEHNISYGALSRITGVPIPTIEKYFSGKKRFSPIRLDGMLIDRAIDVIVENDIRRPVELKMRYHDLEDEAWYDKARAMVNPEEVKEMSKACRGIFAIINEGRETVNSNLEYSTVNYYLDTDDRFVEKVKEENVCV